MVRQAKFLSLKGQRRPAETLLLPKSSDAAARKLRGMFCGRAARRLRWRGVQAGMGYIIAIVLLAIVVPLLFILLSRRPSGAGTLNPRSQDRGVTPAEPSSDQPTPRADAVNQAAPGAERRLPPG